MGVPLARVVAAVRMRNPVHGVGPTALPHNCSISVMRS